MIIDELYARKKLESTDLSEHMDTLRRYASQCKYITEFGVRGGCSTAALLAGSPKILMCRDVADFAEKDLYREIAKENRTAFAFAQIDDCSEPIAPTDLLFIDTIHTYDQLKKELMMHETRVERYIIMHDTHVKPSAASPENDGIGMQRAIAELVAKGKWRIEADYPNQHGLTILERIAK